MASRFVTDIDKVPVTVLTGFLGAGKTTQLNHPHRTARQADRRHRERVRRGRCDVAGAADVDALVAGQTPGRWVNLVGELVIARNPRPPVRPAELPAELAKAVESEVALYRVGAVWQLAQWITNGDPGQNLTATDVLERLTRDYDQRVQTAAKAVLAGQVASRPRVPESTPAPLASPEADAAAPAAEEPALPAGADDAEVDLPTIPAVPIPPTGDRVPGSMLRTIGWLSVAGLLAVVLALFFPSFSYPDGREEHRTHIASPSGEPPRAPFPTGPSVHHA